MPRAYSVLAPALTSNAVLDLSIPVASGSSSKKNLSEASVVRHYDLKPFTRNEEEQALLGQIKRIAVSQGPLGDENEQVVSSYVRCPRGYLLITPISTGSTGRRHTQNIAYVPADSAI